MKNNFLTYGAVLAGIVFIIIAIVYWTNTAGSLPHFFPGFEAGATNVHVKHGIASLFLGLALFAYAWFRSGKKTIAEPK
jgi:ammonia channel protein AmtB